MLNNYTQYSLKYRPTLLKDVAGHVEIINNLKNRSKLNSFPYVTFLQGDTGTGKTTLSYIIAKLINCHNKVLQEEGYYEPCNQCNSCIDINKENFTRDTYYFDASNMGKDDVLKIKEKVVTSSMFDSNKVIIINEAQELSKQGKGAILDLLEKQQTNVYFILCTMDITSLNKAVKSRGQNYYLNKLDSIDIANYLLKVIKDENLMNNENIPDDFFTEGLFTIAESADGSLRDALQILENCVFSNNFTKDFLINNLKLVSSSTVLTLLEKIFKFNYGVFNDLLTMDLKIFYEKSKNSLIDAYILFNSPVEHDNKKLQSLSILKPYKAQLEALIEKYNLIDLSPQIFLNGNNFLYQLMKFFKENENKVISQNNNIVNNVATRRKVN